MKTTTQPQPTQSTTSQSAVILEIPVARIRASATNPRTEFDETYIEELAASIKSRGLMQPITVRPDPDSKGQFLIIAGECRWRAHKVAKLPQIRAQVRNDVSEAQAMELQVLENLQRRDLNPIDEARGFRQLLDLPGADAATIAARLGKPKTYIYERLKLLNLPPEASKALLSGELPESTAILIGRIPDSHMRGKITKVILKPLTASQEFGTYLQANEGPLSFKLAKEFIQKHAVRELKGAPFDPEDATLVPRVKQGPAEDQPEYGGACSKCPQRSGARGDACAYTSCYSMKAQAAWEREAAEAKKRGLVVVPLSLSSKWRPHIVGGKVTHLGSGSDAYVLPDAPCWEDAKRRTWSQMLGKDLPRALAVARGPSGPIEVIDTSLAKSLIRSKGVLLTSDPAYRDKEKKEREARTNAMARFEGRVWDLLGQICNHAVAQGNRLGVTLTHLDVRSMAQALVGSAFYDAIDDENSDFSKHIVPILNAISSGSKCSDMAETPRAAVAQWLGITGLDEVYACMVVASCFVPDMDDDRGYPGVVNHARVVRLANQAKLAVQIAGLCAECGAVATSWENSNTPTGWGDPYRCPQCFAPESVKTTKGGRK